jgi:hypothetical protein
MGRQSGRYSTRYFRAVKSHLGKGLLQGYAQTPKKKAPSLLTSTTREKKDGDGKFVEVS